MAIRNALLAGIKAASAAVDDDKTSVSFEAWIGSDGQGADTFAAATMIRAVVSRKARRIRTSGGQFAHVVATLTVLDTIAPTTAQAGQTRLQPVDPRDRFTLLDGTTAPVVHVGGPFDPVTQDTYIKSIVLGNVARGQ